MANRMWNRYQALEKEIKALYLEVAIGATGAPTLTYGEGVTSIARTATGDYTITLDEKYNRFANGTIVQMEADDEDLTFQFASETVATTKTVKFICKAAATPTDPSSGSKLFIKLELKNSSV